MNKAEQAIDLYNLLNLYTDYIESGFKNKHTIPDFSNIDNVNKRNEEKPVIKKDDTQKENADIADINNKKRAIISIAERIIKCTKCNLHKDASKVPGAGNCNADIFVVSYPPSQEEESAGRPLMGEAGNFFKKWLNAIEIKFDEVFISNIIKCPPKKNKVGKENIEICINYLDEQLDVVAPKVILSLGQLTLSSLKKSFVNIAQSHGKTFDYKGIPFMPTYHPLDVLSNPSLKKTVWEDLKKFKKYFQGNFSLNE